MSVLVNNGEPLAFQTELWSGPEIADAWGITRASAYQWISRWADRQGEVARVLIRSGTGHITPFWSDEQVQRMESERKARRKNGI